MMTASKIADHLSLAIAERGAASLIVSGGSSPLAIFKALTAMKIDWAKVTISLVDDRDVPADHTDSNELLLQTHLLKGEIASANFISLARDPDEVAMIARPFDVMLLGMGTDGHFASLFPDMVSDEAAFGLGAAPTILRTGIKGSPAHPRVTMNLAMILQSSHIYLLVNGAAKTAVFADAQHNHNLPIAALLQQKITNIEIIMDSPS
ncbi:MAG: 6-phosphogluconolactonase [Candidatus Puniceispirillum sp.]|jgi:6-phosphogluconolactonase|nr:6-phosphogluconolactonase [Candidatus Puniceispirillum sp.]MDA8676323.1 6-phosphogluconolactonase [Alphaproteobacteria bacterium]MDG2466238.1 6-phosphogluconolactonase [Alphaproteobacteria bacterium]